MPSPTKGLRSDTKSVSPTKQPKSPSPTRVVSPSKGRDRSPGRSPARSPTHDDESDDGRVRFAIEEKPPVPHDVFESEGLALMRSDHYHRAIASFSKVLTHLVKIL